MKRLLKYKRIYLLLLIPISFLLILAAKKSSFFAEDFYALHIYKWISQPVSLLSGLFPFSMAEIIVYAMPVILLVLLTIFLVRLIRQKENRGIRLTKGILNLLCALSVIGFLFVICGGLNYYRYPFSYYSGLEIMDSSVEELYTLTESLALQADELRAQTTGTDENGVFKLTESMHDLADQAGKAMKALAEDYPVLGGYYASPKPVLSSAAMSSAEITGMFFPFTMEANINVDVPDYSIPATMLHEMAHLRGFMREDEANYIAYIAGMASDDPEIRYSAAMLALITAGNALYDKNQELYFEIRELYSEGVLKDIRANSAYWIRYDNTAISTLSNKVNDTYLKANAQVDGVQSYGRMLDLLLAKFRQDNANDTTQ